MKKYVMQICIIAAVCLLGATAFCGYHIYDHYAHEAEQTEAFEQIAEVVEQAQTGEEAPQVPLNEEETILPEYGDLFLQNPDMVGWISIAGTKLNYPVMQTPNNPNFYLKHNFEKAYSASVSSEIGRNTMVAQPMTRKASGIFRKWSTVSGLCPPSLTVSTPITSAVTRPTEMLSLNRHTSSTVRENQSLGIGSTSLSCEEYAYRSVPMVTPSWIPPVFSP